MSLADARCFTSHAAAADLLACLCPQLLQRLCTTPQSQMAVIKVSRPSNNQTGLPACLPPELCSACPPDDMQTDSLTHTLTDWRRVAVVVVALAGWLAVNCWCPRCIDQVGGLAIIFQELASHDDSIRTATSALIGQVGE